MPEQAPTSFFLLENRRYPALDGLRAMAAFMIFNVHFFAQYAEKNYFVPEGSLAFHLLRTIHSGSLGVDILFLLSGCLTALSVARHQRVSAPLFMAQRFKRLLPVILAVNLPALCWGADAVDWRQLADNVFFLNLFHGTTLVSYITWAIVYEMWFYLFFCVFFILPRRWPFARGWAWFFGVWALLLADVVWWNSFSPFNDPRFLDFMVGILLARLMSGGLARPALDRLDRLARLAWLPGLCAIFFLCWLWSLDSWIQAMSGSLPLRLGFYLLFDAATAALFWRLLMPGGVSLILGSRPLRIVGVVSYSLFMTHAQWGLPITLALFGKASSLPGLAGAWAASIGMSVLIAVMLFSFLERPYFVKA